MATARVLPPATLITTPIEKSLRPCPKCEAKGKFQIQLVNWGSSERMGIYCENGHGAQVMLPPTSVGIDITKRYEVLKGSAMVLADFWNTDSCEEAPNEK
jgi:hypothetical protein